MEWAFVLIPSISVIAWLLYEARLRRPTTIKVPELVELPKAFVYDWVRDDGWLWTGPGDTAFWLEPETCDELASWYARYRPTDYGLHVVSADVQIEWMEPVPDRRAIQSLIQSQYQNSLQQQQYSGYGQSPYLRLNRRMWGGL